MNSSGRQATVALDAAWALKAFRPKGQKRRAQVRHHLEHLAEATKLDGACRRLGT